MEVFLTDYPAGDVDSHNIIYSWCAQTQVSMHSCESTSGYCREREIDRILLCTISDDDIPEGVTRKAILTSCVLVYVKKIRRTKIADLVEEHVLCKHYTSNTEKWLRKLLRENNGYGKSYENKCAMNYSITNKDCNDAYNNKQLTKHDTNDDVDTLHLHFNGRVAYMH